MMMKIDHAGYSFFPVDGSPRTWPAVAFSTEKTPMKTASSEYTCTEKPYRKSNTMKGSSEPSRLTMGSARAR
jgi:hypothetical protein